MGKERQVVIAEKWEEGWTSGEIARHLDITRGAVMGVIHRLKAAGIVFHRKSKETVTSVPPITREEPMVEKPKLFELKIKIPPFPPPEDEPEQLEEPSVGVTIMALTRKSCRYVLGPVTGANTLYCGKPINGRAFCKEHRRLCYVYAKPPATKPASTP